MTVGHTTATATLTSTGCADPAGMNKCATAASTTSAQCIAAANGDSVSIEGCGCAWYIANINCYASHCWNRAYECEYQAYASEYFELCLIAKFPLPYFPAPDGAPDSCSCNAGKIIQGIAGSIDEIQNCLTDQQALVGLGGVFEADAECQCCGVSGAISSIYNFCPTTDPSLVGLGAVSLLENTLGRPFTSCSPQLSRANCSELGYDSTVVGGTFLKPDNLPLNGTATLSNTPGTVTAPASGTVFTYTNLADKQVYTISAVNAPRGKSGTGGSGSNGSGIPSTSSSAIVNSAHPGRFALGVLAVLAFSGCLYLN